MIIWQLSATVKESLGTRLRQSIRSGNRVVALFVRYIIVLCILYLCILLRHNCPSFPAAFHRILYLCILLIHNWTLPAIRILPFLLSPHRLWPTDVFAKNAWSNIEIVYSDSWKPFLLLTNNSEISSWPIISSLCIIFEHMCILWVVRVIATGRSVHHFNYVHLVCGLHHA